MRRRRTVITRCAALEYAVPALKDGAVEKGASNVIVRLDAVGKQGPVVGAGEFPLRGRPDSSPSANWRSIQTMLQRVEGEHLSERSAANREQVADLVADMRELAERSAETDGDTVSEAALAGVEMALLDLAASATGTSVAEFLGGVRDEVRTPVLRAHYERPGRRLRPRIDGTSTPHAIKIVGLGGVADSMDAVTELDWSATPSPVVILDFAGQLKPDEAHDLVDMLAKRIDAADLPAHVVVQRPFTMPEVERLVQLQRMADAMIAPSTDRPGIVLMVEGPSFKAAEAAVEAGVRGLDLNVFRSGGLLTVADTAQRVKSMRPDIRLCLSSDPQTSDVCHSAVIELAGAVQQLDYLESSARNDASSDRSSPGGSDIAGEFGPSFAPFVGKLKKYAEVPRRSARPQVKRGLKANNFDLSTVKGFATYAWGIPLTSHLVERAALARGLNTTRLWTSVFLAHHPGLPKPVGFGMRRSGWTAVSARRVADDKELARRVLRNADVSVPRGAAFKADEVDAAVEFAASLDRPVVVKPRDGSHGIGVAIDLRTENDVRRAVRALSSTAYRNHDFIVEEYVEGSYYRFLVVGDQVVSVVLCEPASVTGDGKSSIVDLVVAKNQMRLKNPHGHTRLIELGSDARLWLERQGMSFSSVPAKGEDVRIGSAGNVASGGDSIDVLDETHPSMLDFAVRATRAVPGLDHCGVDLIGDHTRAAEQQHAAIIEINSAPGTVLNHYPLFGPSRDVSSELLLRSCHLAGFNPPEARVQIAVRLEVFGVVQRVGYRAWFAQRARERGLTGSIKNTSAGTVEAYVAGPTEQVAAVVSRAYVGPRKAAVSQVETTHVDHVTPDDQFEVL